MEFGAGARQDHPTKGPQRGQRYNKQWMRSRTAYRSQNKGRHQRAHTVKRVYYVEHLHWSNIGVLDGFTRNKEKKKRAG